MSPGSLVVLGAAVGAPAGYLISQVVPGRRGTLLVNVTGSLALGLVAGVGPLPFAVLGTGFCGAFTTFSAFSVEAAVAERRVGWRYCLVSVLGCLAAVALGRVLAGGGGR